MEVPRLRLTKRNLPWQSEEIPVTEKHISLTNEMILAFKEGKA